MIGSVQVGTKCILVSEAVLLSIMSTLAHDCEVRHLQLLAVPTTCGVPLSR